MSPLDEVGRWQGPVQLYLNINAAIWGLLIAARRNGGQWRPLRGEFGQSKARDQCAKLGVA